MDTVFITLGLLLLLLLLFVGVGVYANKQQESLTKYPLLVPDFHAWW